VGKRKKKIQTFCGKRGGGGRKKVAGQRTTLGCEIWGTMRGTGSTGKKKRQPTPGKKRRKKKKKARLDLLFAPGGETKGPGRSLLWGKA